MTHLPIKFSPHSVVIFNCLSFAAPKYGCAQIFTTPGTLSVVGRGTMEWSTAAAGNDTPLPLLPLPH